MAIDQSKAALEEALKEYYALQISESFDSDYTPVLPPSASTELTEWIGVVVHYPIKSIMDAVKEKTFFRAKHIVVEGKPIAGLAVTSDDEDMLMKEMKNAIKKVFRAVSHGAKFVTDPNQLDENPTVNDYTDQVAFVKGEVWRVTEGEVVTLFKCITDTETPPATDTLDWLTLEDGDQKRVYFLLLLNPYWDTNMADSLDEAIFNAIVAFVLREWYEVTGLDPEVMKWKAKFDDYVSDARMATFKRKKGINRMCSPI